jgi:hypothetical protein
MGREQVLANLADPEQVVYRWFGVLNLVANHSS